MQLRAAEEIEALDHDAISRQRTDKLSQIDDCTIMERTLFFSGEGGGLGLLHRLKRIAKQAPLMANGRFIKLCL
jgi:hypothetical protein